MTGTTSLHIQMPFAEIAGVVSRVIKMLAHTYHSLRQGYLCIRLQARFKRVVATKNRVSGRNTNRVRRIRSIKTNTAFRQRIQMWGVDMLIPHDATHSISEMLIGNDKKDVRTLRRREGANGYE